MLAKQSILTLSILCLGIGCGDNAGTGTGKVRLFLESEETITLGLQPGTELENIKDGWTVQYNKLLYVAGKARAKSSSGSATLSEESVYLLDLKRISESGFELLSDDTADAVRYDDVSFSNPVASASVKLGPDVADADKASMVDGGWSIFIAGEITKPDGESCLAGSCTAEKRVRFAWGLPAPTLYEHCGPEGGDLGFAVTRGGTTTANFTIHGDHWFFNGFPEGAEIVDRQAQWVADADLDHDGATTLDELKMTKASDVFPSTGDRKYSFAGAPAPVKTAYDFVFAQAQTVGHFQGEGECEWRALE
jgi:hypothetical protein